MSSTSASDRKRKPEKVFRSHNCDDQSNSKARRVSTDAQASTLASDETNEEVTTAVSSDDQSVSKARRVSTDAQASTLASDETNEGATAAKANANAASDTTATQEDESMEIIGALIQDLSHSDNAKVNAALYALSLDIDKDKKKSKNIHAVGGCLALVYLMKNCLDKAIDKVPGCDQVTNLRELPNLKTLRDALLVIDHLIRTHRESRVGISSVGGVETVVKIMKTFPKCEEMQWVACAALGILTRCNLGTKKAAETDAMEVLVATVNNHLNSADMCGHICLAFYNLIKGNKESMQIFLRSGGVSAVTKVREQWPDDNTVQKVVRKVMEPVVKELSCWTQAK
jgi:hypothetical protein